MPARGNASFPTLAVLTFLLGVVSTFAVVGVRTDARLATIEGRLSTLETELAQVGSFTLRHPVTSP